MKKYSFINNYLRRVFVEFPTTIFCIGVVVAIYYGYYTYNEKYKESLVPSLFGTAWYVAVIVVLDVLYNYVAGYLVNWENHRF